MKRKIKNKKSMKTKHVFMVLIIALFTWMSMYFGMPTLSYGWFGWPTIVLFIGAIITLFSLDDGDFEADWTLPVGLITMGVGALFILILPFGSSVMFRSNDYRNLIGNVEVKTFSNDISPIAPEEIVLIDYDVAAKLADKKLVSEDMALGSQTTIGQFTLQKVGKHLYYVAPLNHTSFWKWRNMKQGTTGYMIVNAINQNDVRLIKTNPITGEEIRLKYQSGGCFGDYIDRHIYRNGYRNVGFTDISFEIDDDYNPWYVVTLYDKKVGYAGKDAFGCLLVNPKDGTIKEYGIDDAPAWVDRIQPKEFINTQFDDWGKWVHGWPNWSDQDKMVLSQGSQLIYGEDGNCYFYSGVTSVGQDDASMGFVLINTRNKKTTFYKSGGAIESATQSSAEGKVQEKQYKASFPRPYNINGVWTYVMAMKDAEGLIKAVALVSYANYEIVGIGENIQDAIRNYKAVLNSKGNVLAPSSDNTLNQIRDIIYRIGTDVKEGQLYYYMVLNKYPNTLFIGTSNMSNEFPVSEKGDSVKINFVSGADEGEIFIDKFDNLHFNFKKTTEQLGKILQDSLVDVRIDNENIDNSFKANIENLTTEEKAELNKQLKKK
jgi:hypothetical protein